MADENERIAKTAMDNAREGIREVGAAAGAAAGEMRRGSAAVGQAAMQSGTVIAGSMQEIAQAWTSYAQDVMHRTTAASQALMQCRNFSDALRIQSDLMRGQLQAFIGHSTKLAEITSDMTTQTMSVAGDTAKTGRNRP